MRKPMANMTFNKLSEEEAKKLFRWLDEQKEGKSTARWINSKPVKDFKGKWF